MEIFTAALVISATINNYTMYCPPDVIVSPEYEEKIEAMHKNQSRLIKAITPEGLVIECLYVPKLMQKGET